MATVINNPAPAPAPQQQPAQASGDNGGGFGSGMAVTILVVVLLLILLFFVFGRGNNTAGDPSMENGAEMEMQEDGGGTEFNVPDEIDVNVEGN